MGRYRQGDPVFIRASLVLLLAVMLAACPQLSKDGESPDMGKGKTGKPPPPPPPNPLVELEKMVQQAERDLAQLNADQLKKLDGQLYDRARGLDPTSPAVQHAQQVRGKVKARLYPAYLKMAEESFKDGRFDDAFRQAGYVPDSAGPDLLERRKAILGKMPGILKKRDACAKRWSLKACKLHEQHRDWPLKLCKALYDEMIGLDMTKDMVRISWGEPLQVERETVKEKGREELKETWYYSQGAYVVFTGAEESKLRTTELHN